MIQMERDTQHTRRLMNQLEELMLKKGWPVPFSPFYLVHHEEMLAVLDQLRMSLQDDLDARFMYQFQVSNEDQHHVREESRPLKVGSK
jgi:hypothetical protein